jgi:hypothetical protein
VKEADRQINYPISTSLFAVSNLASEAADLANDGLLGDVETRIAQIQLSLAKALVLLDAAQRGIEDPFRDAIGVVKVLQTDPVVDVATHEPGITGD